MEGIWPLCRGIVISSGGDNHDTPRSLSLPFPVGRPAGWAGGTGLAGLSNQQPHAFPAAPRRSRCPCPGRPGGVLCGSRPQRLASDPGQPLDPSAGGIPAPAGHGHWRLPGGPAVRRAAGSHAGRLPGRGARAGTLLGLPHPGKAGQPLPGPGDQTSGPGPLPGPGPGECRHGGSGPGTSEHQLGLAVDIVDADYQLLNHAQEDTAVHQWLLEHCWDYGFILRYPADKGDVTGIIYEPWHYRYVGREHAQAIRAAGLCLEEYLYP